MDLVIINEDIAQYVFYFLMNMMSGVRVSFGD